MISNIKEADVTEILPNLWLGNYKSSINKNFLIKYNIKCIIRVLPEKLPVYKNIEYINIPLKDKHICNKNINDIFRKCNNIIDNYLKKNQGILVHCKRGHQRSASVIASYIFKKYNLKINDVILYIKERRPLAFSRKTCFLENLLHYYKS